MNICLNTLTRTQACFFVLVLLAISHALPSFAETNSLEYGKLSTDEMIQIYDEMERELLVRFGTQKEEKSRHLSKTIEALGHIRSPAGMEKLLANIDIQPENYEARVGPFYSITPSNASSVQGLYVAFRVLESENILPVERIIQEAEAAVPGSKRETLLVLLGYSCYGDAFANYVKDRKRTKSSTSDWENINKRYSGLMAKTGDRDRRPRK